MKVLLTTIISFSLISVAYGQQYLIKEKSWQEKIKKNHSLSPLFYGIKKTPAQQDDEKKLTKKLLEKYGSVNSAYNQSLIDGWNYFYIGKLDSAILNFNQAYLLDKNNPEVYIAFGSLLTFINGKPSTELIEKFHLIDKVSSGWDLMIFFGDNIFLETLKTVQQKNPINKSLIEVLKSPVSPYLIDSERYVILKIKYDNHEGTYKMGRRWGAWTDYYGMDFKHVMRYYTISNGKETGEITAFHKNGKLMSIFNKNSNGDLDGDCKVYDYNGQLVRIEHWHKNSYSKKDSKVFKEWEEDGTTTYETVNGQTQEFIWKDGQKTIKK